MPDRAVCTYCNYFFDYDKETRLNVFPGKHRTAIQCPKCNRSHDSRIRRVSVSSLCGTVDEELLDQAERISGINSHYHTRKFLDTVLSFYVMNAEYDDLEIPM